MGGLGTAEGQGWRHGWPEGRLHVQHSLDISSEKSPARGRERDRSMGWKSSAGDLGLPDFEGQAGVRGHKEEA